MHLGVCTNTTGQYVTAGSGVVGDYISDTMSIGGITVTNLTMAVATSANATQTGIMGIGLDTDESTEQFTGTNYPNLPDVLKSEGKIGTKAYSLYLDDLGLSASWPSHLDTANVYVAAASGTVIFGGYDTAKFTGELIMMPLQTDSQTGIVDSFAVAWTSLAYTDANGTYTVEGSSDFPAAAILDSGTTLTYLPLDLFTDLADAFAAENSSEVGAWVVNCNIGQTMGSVDYGFGGSDGPVIAVPFAELATPAYNNDGSWATDQAGEKICLFGIQPNTPGTPLLFGQTFLRSAYVMYDLENLYAGLAPTVFDTTDSNIVEYQASSAQASITTDTSGPTVTASSESIGPGNPFTSLTSATSVTLSSSGFGSLGTSGGVSWSSGSVQYTRSYPSVTVPTQEPSSLTAIGGSAGAGTTTAASSSASSTGTSAAAPRALPAFSSSVACVVLGTIALSLFGGMLVL